jgi:hypothetical protein
MPLQKGTPPRLRGTRGHQFVGLQEVAEMDMDIDCLPDQETGFWELCGRADCIQEFSQLTTILATDVRWTLFRPQDASKTSLAPVGETIRAKILPPEIVRGVYELVEGLSQPFLSTEGVGGLGVD